MEKIEDLFNFKVLTLIIILISADLMTKGLAIANLSMGVSNDFFFPFIELLLINNYGVAFGVFDSGGSTSSKILLILGILILFYLFYLLTNEENKKKKIALSIILGGAMGNIIDRALNGFVTDFLHLKVNNFSFFIFNLADVFITIGAVLIIYFEIKINTINVKTN